MPCSACAVFSITEKFFIFPWHLPLLNFRIKWVLKTKAVLSSIVPSQMPQSPCWADMLLKTGYHTWSSLPLSSGVFTCCRNMLKHSSWTGAWNWWSNLFLLPFSFQPLAWRQKKVFYSTSTLLEVPEIQIDRVGLSMAETHQPSCIFLNVYDCWPPEKHKMVPNARCWLSKKVHYLNDLFTDVVESPFHESRWDKEF